MGYKDEPFWGISNFLSKFTNRKEGKAISRPENIYQNIEQYDIVFCTLIRMELLADIFDLNAWVLLKQFYKQFRLILLLKGKTQEYYKASHYLYDMTYSMHDDIFYANEETVSLKRLQRQGVGALGHFLPVQKVNKELLNLFTQPLSDYADLNFLTWIFFVYSLREMRLLHTYSRQKAAWITYQKQKYFSLEIPILAEKYEKLNKWIGSSFKKGKLE